LVYLFVWLVWVKEDYEDSLPTIHRGYLTVNVLALDHCKFIQTILNSGNDWSGIVTEIVTVAAIGQAVSCAVAE